jgi:hypothetical protein
MTPDEILRSAYVSALPEPGESCIDLAGKILGSKRLPKPHARFELATEYIEAPSALMAFEVQFREIGRPLDLVTRVATIQTPDPRMPLRPGVGKLWDYRGTATASRVLPQPSARQVDRVAPIAAGDYDLASWSRLASVVAQNVTDHDIEALAAVMVYPSQPPKGFSAWRWILHLQLATALVLSRSSVAAATALLFDLIDGVMDWTVDAAIVALANVADDEQIRRRLFEALGRRLRAIPAAGYCCYELPLVLACLRIQGAPPDLVSIARERFLRLA